MKIKRKLFAKIKALTHSVRNKKVPFNTFIDRNNNAESRLDTPIFEEIGKEAYRKFGDDHSSASMWISEELEKSGTHPDALAPETEKSLRHYLRERKSNRKI